MAFPNGDYTRYSTQPQRALPPIKDLLDRSTFPCARCNLPFQRSEDRDVHEQRCQITGTTASHLTQSSQNAFLNVPPHSVYVHPAQQQYQPVRGIDSVGPISVVAMHQRRASSPMMVYDEREYNYDTQHDSRRESSMYTPRQQRRASPLGTRARQHAFQQRERHTPTSDSDKRKTKKQKEQNSRKQEARVTQITEDFLQNYLALVLRSTQTAGNSNEAGLEGVKIANHRTTLGLLKYLIHRQFIEALQQGRLDEWREELVAVCSSSLDNEDLTKGTFLADPDEKEIEFCEHERGQRACIVHGTPDHVKCRKERMRNNFKKNLDNWYKENARLSRL